MITNNLKNKLHQRPDLIGKYDLELEGESNCCNAPIIIDIEMCSECNDYCTQREPICKFCGDDHPEWDEDDFCSDDCWNGYYSETFKEN